MRTRSRLGIFKSKVQDVRPRGFYASASRVERRQSGRPHQLVPLVYDELRRLASDYLRGERPGHLLQSTALANEAYLRLVERRHVSIQTRTQFLAVAAQVMRRILVNYARERNRVKRGRRCAGLGG